MLNGVDDCPVIQCGDIIVDIRCHTVYLNDNEINLFPKEFAALCLFVKHPDWVYTKKEIYEAIYDDMTIEIDNIIYCLIHSLRKKIEPDLRNPKYIKTIRGVGYKLLKSH